MFDIDHHGSIVLVRPLTADVKAWLLENVDGHWFGGALVAEPRFIDELVSALIHEGFAKQ